nr:alpha/beta hydrolase [Pseudomonas carbonaria]
MAHNLVPGLATQVEPHLQHRFPERLVPLADGTRLAIRECGSGPVVVLLHGIGSGSASWLHCARWLAESCRVIAWDAPGYGRSTPLPQARPRAVDYAARLELLLQVLEVERCVLVGHSLGALMATAYAAGPGARRVAQLLLISPARGYGAAELADSGARIRQQRLDNLDRLGIEGLASERTARLLGPNPSEEALAWVRWNMARLNPSGYRQAVELLCGDDLLGYGPLSMPCEVHCGEADGITTPDVCALVARRLGAPFSLIPGAGHASPIEQPAVVAGRIDHAQRQSLKGSANG